MDSTRPTASVPFTEAPWSTMDSTSMPMLFRAASSRSAVRSAGSSTSSRNQDSATRISLHLHAERAGEPHIALDELAHVAQTVAEHERTVDAHPERETGVDVRVDTARAQHVRVD